MVPVPALLLAIAAALAVGALAGLYPALRAARLSPADSLRSVCATLQPGGSLSTRGRREHSGRGLVPARALSLLHRAISRLP